MVGRGIFENLFLFAPSAARRFRRVRAARSPRRRSQWFQRHIDLHQQTWGAAGRFDTLKKFAKTYLRAFEGASRLVDAVMHTRTHEAACEVLTSWLAGHLADQAVPAMQ